MKQVKSVFIVLFVAYLIVGLLLYLLQEKFIFQGKSMSKSHRFEYETDFDEVFLTAEDGASLHGLHFKSADSKGVILYFHGNRGNLTRWGNEVQLQVKLGYDVIVMDYRGYGKSDGERTSENLLSDAQSFYSFAKAQYSENQITVYGRSLGSGIANFVASQNQPLRLILETPYFNFRTLVQRFAPMYPVSWFLRFNFASNEYLQNVRCPVTIFHGTKDKVVPYDHGKRLFEQMGSDQASLVTIEGGGHTNLAEFELFRNELQALLK